jgi:glycosyltransferase involved in cell wall biosynthesis
MPDLTGVAEALLREHRLDPLLILHRRGDLPDGFEGTVKFLVLEDYAMALEVFRPSSVRLLTKTLAETRPIFAVSEIVEPLDILADSGVGTYYLPDARDHLSPAKLASACERASRVLVPSPEAFEALARALGHYPARVGRRADALPAVLEMATRDFGLDGRHLRPHDLSDSGPTRKVLIPSSDWNVSGVNASVEALGQELIKLGWDVEIVFTRDKASVLESAQNHMPKLPYRFLQRDRSGVDAMWEALVAELEANAPCIAFLGYDFIANSVAPALTERVGVVSWVQADDGDYYEQTYRLGRYCNRVVCVSRHISERVSSLNPVVGELTRVIHNSSVWQPEIAARRGRRSRLLRIVYAGRLVQYQKRILDYVDLAKGLDAAGSPYEITLIGNFSAREGAQDIFEQRAADHIADGRIKLSGRMSRERILEQLVRHDFYVLLSDFEGMPLAVIEAMAQGCVPVVGPIASGIPELIADGENGVIIDHRDYAAWAKLLIELQRDRGRLSRLSREARRTVRERLTVERVGKQFHDLFSEVADEVSSGVYERPTALTWGDDRSPTGDVLPPPSLHRPAALKLRGLS